MKQGSRPASKAKLRFAARKFAGSATRLPEDIASVHCEVAADVISIGSG